jgi:hypothetical protein
VKKSPHNLSAVRPDGRGGGEAGTAHGAAEAGDASGFGFGMPGYYSKMNFRGFSGIPFTRTS